MRTMREIAAAAVLILFVFPCLAAIAAAEDTDPYAEIRPLLDEKTAVLVYDAGGGTVDVVRSGGVTTRELGKTAEPLEVKIGFFSDIMGSLNAMTPYQDEAATLWAVLIKPVIGDLAGIERLGIVPGKKLCRLYLRRPCLEKGPQAAPLSWSTTLPSSTRRRSP